MRQKLGLEAGQEVKYELHCLPNYHHVFFSWRLQLRRTARFTGRWQNVLKRFVSNSLLKIMTYRLIRGLFSLHLKMVMLEKASERFSVSPTYFNSTLYLNARLSQPVTQKKHRGDGSL